MKASRFIQHIANEIANNGDRDVVIKVGKTLYRVIQVEYSYGKDTVIIEAYNRNEGNVEE